MTELKPCPFCGSHNLKSGGDDKIVGTWCLACEATGPNQYGSHDWNTRTPPTVKALEWEDYGAASTTKCGSYRVFLTASGCKFVRAVRSSFYTQYVSDHSTKNGLDIGMKSAKAACQEDFERRIRECLL